MAQKIQRQPGGLAELLLTFGGVTPNIIEDSVRATLEALQFYALGNRQVISGTGAPVEGGAIQIVTPQAWSVLFAAEANFVKTATLTALNVSLLIGRTVAMDSVCVASKEYTQFGATVTGGSRLPFVPPYPWLLPPQTRILGIPDIIGTDATITLSVRAELGVLQ